MQTLSNSSPLILLIISLVFFLTFLYSLGIVRLRKLLKEKTLKNEELKFIFTDINPTPIIRTDAKGVIIYSNEKAKKEFDKIELQGAKVKEIFAELKGMEIPNNSNRLVALGKNYYSMEVRYIENLDNWHLFFYDVTKQLEQANKVNISILTKREKQVFNLVSKGFTSDEIAVQLNCCKRTVTTHRYKINKKLNLHR